MTSVSVATTTWYLSNNTKALFAHEFVDKLGLLHLHRDVLTDLYVYFISICRH